MVNSEVSRRRVALEARIATLDRWATKAEDRERRASARHLKWVGMERIHTKAGYRALQTALRDLRDQGGTEKVYQATCTSLWAAYAATCADHPRKGTMKGLFIEELEGAQGAGNGTARAVLLLA